MEQGVDRNNKIRAMDVLKDHGRMDTVVFRSSNLPLHESAFETKQRRTDEYVYDPDDRPDVKNKKTIKRQLNLLTMVNNNPIIIGANPKILSMDGIPAIDFMDQQAFGRDAFKKEKHGKFGIAEERMVRYKGVDYEQEINKINVKEMKKTHPGIKFEKTESYDVDRRRVKKGENPG